MARSPFHMRTITALKSIFIRRVRMGLKRELTRKQRWQIISTTEECRVKLPLTHMSSSTCIGTKLTINVSVMPKNILHRRFSFSFRFAIAGSRSLVVPLPEAVRLSSTVTLREFERMLFFNACVAVRKYATNIPTTTTITTKNVMKTQAAYIRYDKPAPPIQWRNSPGTETSEKHQIHRNMFFTRCLFKRLRWRSGFAME